MPNPKRRHSKTRTSKRRTHDTLAPVPTGTFPSARRPRPTKCAALWLQGPSRQGSEGSVVTFLAP